VLDAWFQGAIVPRSEHRALGLSLQANQRVVVTPYTCAIVRASDCDPIDLLVFTECDFNPGKANGKSLRELHVQITEDGQQHAYSATPGDRHTVRADQLTTLLPDETALLPADEISVLAYWLASRFSRNAFPDEFNNAWEPVKGKIRSCVGQLQWARMILVKFKDLGEGQYESVFTVVVDAADATDANKMKITRAAATKMESHFISCSNMTNTTVIVEAADSISFEEYRTSFQFDAFDDLSFSRDGHHPPAVT
jgi:hypothetical protein